MTDIKTSAERSKNMAAIKSKNTKPEVFLRKQLFAAGYRYRNNSSVVPGHPDIWLRKYNTAIFVHGCFWHRHPKCKFCYTPKSRVEFWEKKFADNISRDKRIQEELQKRETKCLIVWECTIRLMQKSKSDRESYMQQIEEFICSQEIFAEL